MPAGVDLDAIDAQWTKMCAANPALFDGPILHVIAAGRSGCGGAMLQVAATSFRFHACGDVGVRPLGAKGICRRGDRVLLGKRGKDVHVYGGMWEFAPAGMVEPGRDPAEVVAAELGEETGLTVAAPPVAIALFLDEEARTWEVVHEITVDGELKPGGWEYADLQWCGADALPSPLSPAAQTMAELV